MIRDFLHRLGRDGRDQLVLRSGEPLQQHLLPGREQELPRHGLGEIAVRLLDKPAIAEIEHVPPERKRIPVASPPFHLTRIIQEVRSLPDQVEGHIGEAQINLDRRRMPAPFRKPLAQDQAVVAEPQRIFEQREIRLLRRGRIERAGGLGLPRNGFVFRADRGSDGI
jgi:hypothetical protein